VSDLLYISGGPAIAQALIAGELEAAYLAFSPAVTAAMGGAQLKVLAGVGNGFTHHLFTKEGTGVVRPQDMKGRPAGVSRIGAESHTVVRFWARANGLQDDDITYVNAGGAGERLAALEAGAVDLVPLDPPVVVKAEKLGYRRLADLTREALPWQQDGLAMMERKVNEDPALARAIVADVVEGAYLVRSDAQRAKEVLARYIKEEDPDALEAAYQGYVRRWNERARPDLAGVQGVQEFIDETMPGTAKEPPSRFLDLTILEQLERESFFERMEQQYPKP
jgi:ABC-type nitrate/sulfonate/bicarbonate transport system substrate-binding protein